MYGRIDFGVNKNGIYSIISRIFFDINENSINGLLLLVVVECVELEKWEYVW